MYCADLLTGDRAIQGHLQYHLGNNSQCNGTRISCSEYRYCRQATECVHCRTDMSRWLMVTWTNKNANVSNYIKGTACYNAFKCVNYYKDCIKWTVTLRKVSKIFMIENRCEALKHTQWSGTCCLLIYENVLLHRLIHLTSCVWYLSQEQLITAALLPTHTHIYIWRISTTCHVFAVSLKTRKCSTNGDWYIWKPEQAVDQRKWDDSSSCHKRKSFKVMHNIMMDTWLFRYSIPDTDR